jgi:predicted ferric reductase
MMPPGQYLFLCCPELSAREWHPFTISSSPEISECVDRAASAAVF